jgi:hypothetical protein
MATLGTHGKCVSCDSEYRSKCFQSKLMSDGKTLSNILTFLDLTTCISSNDFSLLFICIPCIKKIESITTFRNNSRRIANTCILTLMKKRLASTLSPVNENSHKRPRVVDQLVSSVEKLTLTNVVGDVSSRKRLFPEVFSPIENAVACSEFEDGVSPLGDNSYTDGCNSLSASTPSSDHSYSDLSNSLSVTTPSLDHSYSDLSNSLSVTSPSLDHSYSDISNSLSVTTPPLDHSYSDCSLSVSTSNDHSCPAVQFVETPGSVVYDCCEIRDQIRRLSAPGVSILSKTAPQDLSERDVFSGAVTEMKGQCESLYNILSVALGDRITHTSKVATLATIYGMILHSNNNRVSAVQRLYTTAAIKYHADNEVSLYSCIL